MMLWKQGVMIDTSLCIVERRNNDICRKRRWHWIYESKVGETASTILSLLERELCREKYICSKHEGKNKKAFPAENRRRALVLLYGLQTRDRGRRD